MKRFIAIVLAFLMVALALTGCSSTSTTGSSSGSSSTSSSSGSSGSSSSSSSSASSGSTATEAPAETSKYSAPGELPIVNDGSVTLTVFTPANGEYSYTDNDQTGWVQEITGINLEWQMAASSDSVRDKLATMFAGETMTDIVCVGVGASDRYSKAEEAQLGAQGVIIPLEDLIDQYSVGYKAAFESLDGMRDYITTPDGHIYSLPNVDGSLHVQYNMKLWLNNQWLENLNLEVPETTDDFYNVMRAFYEEDANGNGDPNDEIPLSTASSGAGTQIDGFLMAPFQLTSETTKTYVDNGVVTYAPVQDGYKEGLKYLADMYAQGWINPESFTWSKDDQVALNEAGDVAVIGAFLSQRPGYACDLSSGPPYSKKWEQYQSLAPLANSTTGQRIAAWNPYVMYQTGMTFISSNCEETQAAFRLVDWLATYEGSMMTAYGKKDEDWRDPIEGELDMDGEPAMYTTLTSGLQNHTWGQLMGRVITKEMAAGLTTNQDPYAEDVPPLTGRLIVLYRASKVHEQYRQDLSTVLPDMFMSEDDVAQMSQLQTNIQSTQKEWLAQFVTGQMNVDSDWDTYVNALESQGLSSYLELLQKAYDVSPFKQ